MKFGIFSLHDIVLSPTQLMNGVVNLRRCMAGESYPGRNDISQAGLTFAKACAKASSTLAVEQEEVGPFPGLCLLPRLWPLASLRHHGRSKCLNWCLVSGPLSLFMNTSTPIVEGRRVSLIRRVCTHRSRRMLATGSLAWKDFFWT